MLMIYKIDLQISDNFFQKYFRLIFYNENRNDFIAKILFEYSSIILKKYKNI